MSWIFVLCGSKQPKPEENQSAFSLNGVHPIGAIEQTVIDTDAAETIVSPVEGVISVTASCVNCADFSGDHKQS